MILLLTPLAIPIYLICSTCIYVDLASANWGISLVVSNFKDLGDTNVIRKKKKRSSPGPCVRCIVLNCPVISHQSTCNSCHLHSIVTKNKIIIATKCQQSKKWGSPKAFIHYSRSTVKATPTKTPLMCTSVEEPFVGLCQSPGRHGSKDLNDKGFEKHQLF